MNKDGEVVVKVWKSENWVDVESVNEKEKWVGMGQKREERRERGRVIGIESIKYI